MSNEMLEKVITTSTVGADDGGILNAEQANRFIDYMWDATILGSLVRKVRMRSPEVDIDKVAVGERLARLATEAVDDGVNAGATFTKLTLTSKKIRLDWEISSESLEDNLEGDALEDHIARLMATQLGNDLEDLAINGDTTLTSNALLKSFNGWRALALAGAHVVSQAGAGLNRAAGNKALKTMPRKYMQRRSELSFFTGSNLIQDYLYSITEADNYTRNLGIDIIANGPVRTEGSAGFVGGGMFGLPVREVPLFDETIDGDYSGATGDHGDLWLTFPQNLIWGVHREIVVYREFKPKKDAIEYTTFTRTGVQIENLDALVVVKNVKVSS